MIVGIQPLTAVTQGRPQGTEPRLAVVPGELVDIRVQDAQGSGSLVILIKGIPFHAASQTSALKPGQVLQARVEKTSDQILLRLLPSSTTRAAVSTRMATQDGAVVWLRQLLPADESAIVSLDRLWAALQASARAGTIPREYIDRLQALRLHILIAADQLEGRRLKHALIRLGLQYEPQLHKHLLQDQEEGPAPLEENLKSWLLARLQDRSGGVDRKSESESGWWKEAERLLRTIERAQLLNALNRQTGQPLVFPLPLAEGRGTLYIEPRDDTPGKDRASSAMRVSLLVELDGLGALRVDTLLDGRDVTMNVSVQGPDRESFLAARLPTLADRLASKGLSVNGMCVSQSTPETVEGVDIRMRALPQQSLVNLNA